MKLGVLTVPLYDRNTEEAFSYLSRLGVQAVEIGTGGSPGSKHADPEELLSSADKLSAYQDLLKKYNLEISAFSCHSNHVHPDADVRALAAKDYAQTLRLAEKMGVHTIVTFSGCPGDGKGAKYPNWVTCSWPPEYRQMLDHQWNDVLIPFWQAAAQEAAEYGVDQIALEMHPGFCVYNPATLLRLREAAGKAIGANFDPSHLFWQGIHPAEAIKALEGAIYHFHAKDTKIDARNTQVNGVLDTGSFGNISDRSWLFRTVGWGHGAAEWKEIITALKMTGYQGTISIEHEDAFMSIEEGLEKAVTFLKDVIIADKPVEAWWN